MPNDIKTFLGKTEKPDSATSLDEKLLELKALLVQLLMGIQLKQVADILENFKNPAKETAQLSENAKKLDEKTSTGQLFLDELEKQAASKKDPRTGETVFILHRPTDNFEYEQCAAGNEFTPTKETVWVTGVMNSELKQQHHNPVVSCFIPQSAIKEMENAHSNTGIWGDLGANPFKDRFRIIVKPGKYVIYSELRE